MKKFGFTLAEVLITLGIIGVIATLTIPSLQTNVRAQSVGPGLAKAINTLENANKMLLTNENARNLTEICGGDANSLYLTCLAENRVLAATRINPFDIPQNLRDYNLTEPGANDANNAL